MHVLIKVFSRYKIYINFVFVDQGRSTYFPSTNSRLCAFNIIARLLAVMYTLNKYKCNFSFRYFSRTRNFNLRKDVDKY